MVYKRGSLVYIECIPRKFHLLTAVFFKAVHEHWLSSRIIAIIDSLKKKINNVDEPAKRKIVVLCKIP